jgi:predicted dehydrogenase
MLEEPVRFVAIADVWTDWRKVVNEMAVRANVDTQGAMRELLDRRNLDAVQMATVGGHAPASFLTAKAGKAVHCEKPSASATA